MEEMQLVGNHYASVGLLKALSRESSHLLWDEIPEDCRLSEERVRRTNGATGHRSKVYLRQHLTTLGCPVAKPFAERKGPPTWEIIKVHWYRCPFKPLENGFCKGHQKRVAEVNDHSH